MFQLFIQIYKKCKATSFLHCYKAIIHLHRQTYAKAPTFPHCHMICTRCSDVCWYFVLCLLDIRYPKIIKRWIDMITRFASNMKRSKKQRSDTSNSTEAKTSPNLSNLKRSVKQTPTLMSRRTVLELTRANMNCCNYIYTWVVPKVRRQSPPYIFNGN